MRRPDERVGLSGRGRVFPVEGTAAAESWTWGGHDSVKELEGGQPNCRVMNGGGRWGAYHTGSTWLWGRVCFGNTCLLEPLKGFSDLSHSFNKC